ncbi:MAG: TolC family protein [Gammaproteobacteria bacterium]|nr:TolC family protein [Gammaproteobacteria bacterium]
MLPKKEAKTLGLPDTPAGSGRRLSYWPNLSVTGPAGMSSEALGDLFGDGAAAVSVSASPAQLVLDNDDRGRSVEPRKLELETALTDYREAVIAAFNDIEVSLRNIGLLEALGVVAAEDLKRAEESFRIAESRYRAGVADFQTVPISQNQLFGSRNACLDNKLAQLNASIDFGQPLGGRWQSEIEAR